MATTKGKKISEFDSLKTLTGQELALLAVYGVNYNCTVDTLKEYVTPDLSGYVTTDTEQTINAEKNFTKGIVVRNHIDINNGGLYASSSVLFKRVYDGIVKGIITYICSAKYIYFRPNGFDSTNGQVIIDNNGIVTAKGFSVLDGKSAQFLKADGSLDETFYMPNTICPYTGYISDSSDKVNSANTDYVYSDYIKINHNYDIDLYISGIASGRIFFYDENKNRISFIAGTNSEQTISKSEIPDNAKYARISSLKDSPNTYSNGPASQANNAGIINAINEATSDLMTEQESSDLYNKIYTEILEEYGDEMNPNPLIDKDNE